MYICFLFITFRTLFGFGKQQAPLVWEISESNDILVESCLKVVSEISEVKPLSSKSL